MPKSDTSTVTVVVAGDVCVNWSLIAHGVHSVHTPLDAERVSMSWELRGAALLTRLIEALTSNDGEVRVVGPEAPPEPITPSDGRLHHRYVQWQRSGNPPVWSIRRTMGIDVSPAPALPTANTSPGDVVVLHDANLGFRTALHAWPRALEQPNKPPCVVLRMSRPIASGPLWQHVSSRCADRLVVITTAGELRDDDLRISAGISWEQTAEDVLRELRQNPRVSGILEARHVIVSFGTAGALLWSRDGEARRAVLVFARDRMEGERSSDEEGYVPGSTTTLVAAITRELTCGADDPDLERGMTAGLRGMCRLREVGYELLVDPSPRLSFPLTEVAETIKAERPVHERSEIPIVRLGPSEAPHAIDRDRHELWTILGETLDDDWRTLASRIVVDGVESALRGVPIGRFGALVTVDRREIEALRAVRALIGEYGSRPQTRPLSIAVFGPPGAGKSFAVKQVAKAVGGGLIESLTFNLSQLPRPEELLGAFHQVRDRVLSGKIPLVFWDEFDTDLGGRPLGWLRHFLAPMQDGEFLEGQITHPIGRAIFVFAGGTFHSLDHFLKDADSRASRAAKVPDFVSRLKGFLDVLGPDPHAGDGVGDALYPIRRAVLLRSMLHRYAPSLFIGGRLQIDPGVLAAFLGVRSYRHGARSIESIITMSRLANVTRFERSCLPPVQQLELHVGASEFMAFVHQPVLEGKLLERLAHAQHEEFCADLERRGYRRGPTTDDRKKVHRSLGPYEELPDHEKDQNRGAVRDIPNKLALRGYVMVPLDGGSSTSLSEEDIEVLAQEEHDRWMAMKAHAGWGWAERTDKRLKLHASMLGWGTLPETEREKDRASIRAIPTLLKRIGYTIRKLDDVAGDG